MYLTDEEIRGRAGDIGFSADLPEHPFSLDVQIQPTSVDLRLGTRFWRPQRFRTGLWWPFKRQAVDLRHRSLHESYPRHDWRDFEAGPDELISLKPGEILLARTYEAFSMPSDLAGRIAARSSYARLGLSIHCGADHINPGWSGRMPLQLVNMSNRTIRLSPLTPLAQVLFIQLSGSPKRPYDDSNKYRNDDGGPSYWWRDQMVEELVSAHGELSLPEGIHAKLQALFATSALTSDQLVRLYEFISKRPSIDVVNWDELISDFAKKETRRSLWSTLARGAIPTAAVLATGAFLSFLVLNWTAWHAIALVAGLFFTGLTVLVIASTKPEFLDSRRLAELRRASPGSF